MLNRTRIPQILRLIRNQFHSKIIRGILGVGGLKFVSLILTMATSILLARVLGPQQYGQYVFAIALVSFLSLMVDNGLGNFLTRELSKYHQDGDQPRLHGLLIRAHQYVGIATLTIYFMAVSVALFYQPWPTHSRWTLVAIALLLIPLHGLKAIRRATLRSVNKVFYAQMPDFIVRPGLHLLLCSFIILVGELSAHKTMIAQISATGTAFLISILLVKKYTINQIHTNTASFQETIWIKSLFPFILLATVTTLNTNIGILALGWLEQDTETAALQIAVRAASIVALSSVIINLVIAPRVTRTHNVHDSTKLKELYKKSARQAFLVATPIALLFIAYGQPIITVLYGPNYTNSVAVPLAILSAAHLINTAFGPVGMFLTMCGYEKDTLKGQFLATTIITITAFLLIPEHGAIGAAIATAIGLFSWNVFLGAMLFRRLNIRPTII